VVSDPKAVASTGAAGPAVLPPLRSHLYAPGNNEKLLGRVLEAGADAVVLDLEDAVPPAEKERARALVADVVAARAAEPAPAVFVRVNHPSTGLTAAEVAAVVRPGLAGIRVPKTESAGEVRQLAAWITAAERAAGLSAGSVVLIPIIESAKGAWRAEEIAAADPRVLALAFGAADFARDLELRPGVEGTETLHARSRLVLASRVAGVRPPIDSVLTRLDDEDALRAEATQARALGYFGKSAIHPRQLPAIHEAFTPTEAEVAHARAIVAAEEQAERAGSGATTVDPAGGAAEGVGREFVDVAVVRRAQQTLALAERLGVG
jgi:citrate lyase subunit beta/citryl-CoA lyase